MKYNKLFFDIEKIENFHSHLIFYKMGAPSMRQKKYQTPNYKWPSDLVSLECLNHAIKGRLKMDLKIFFAINVLYKGSLLLKVYEYVDLGG